jgi:hypothetical protein
MIGYIFGYIDELMKLEFGGWEIGLDDFSRFYRHITIDD